LLQVDTVVVGRDMRLSGPQMFDAVTRVAPELIPRFVLMSGGAPTQELETLINGWRHGVLRKPFQVQDVMTLVASRLERLRGGARLLEVTLPELSGRPRPRAGAA